VCGLDGKPLDSPALERLAQKGIHTVRNLLTEDLTWHSPTSLHIHPATLNKVRAAIPATWSDIIGQGYPPLQVGSYIAPDRSLPFTRVWRIDDVQLDDDGQPQEYLCMEFELDPECVLLSTTLASAADIPTFPVAANDLTTRNLLFTTPHRRGLLFESFTDSQDLNPTFVRVDQLIKGRIVATPLLSVTVHGTRSALMHASIKNPSFEQWEDDLGRPPPWRKFFAWTWARERDHKSSDFLWRLVHRSLHLGVDRRGYSQDTSCPLCNEGMETYDHFLGGCPVTRPIFDLISSAWTRTTGSTLDLSHPRLVLLAGALHSSSRSPRARQLRLLRGTLMAETLYTIWLFRCRTLFDQEPVSSAALRSHVKHRVQRALEVVLSIHRKQHDTFSELCSTLTRLLR